MAHTRPIFLHGPLGQRELREVLSGLFAGLILAPQNIWLVSAWLTDFDVMDNSSGQWSILDPTWGNRPIKFSELLAKAINEGADLSIATRRVDGCLAFLENLRARVQREEGLVVKFRDKLHLKGMLTQRFYLRGSMNFTFSGANRWDEGMELSDCPDVLSTTYCQFRDSYFPEGEL